MTVTIFQKRATFEESQISRVLYIWSLLNISWDVAHFIHFPHSRVWDVASSYSTEKQEEVVELLFRLGVSQRVHLISLNSSRRNSMRVVSEGKNCNFHNRW